MNREDWIMTAVLSWISNQIFFWVPTMVINETENITLVGWAGLTETLIIAFGLFLLASYSTWKAITNE